MRAEVLARFPGQHLDSGGGLRAVYVEHHHRPGQAGCEAERAGAGLPCKSVEQRLQHHYQGKIQEEARIQSLIEYLCVN